MKQKFDSGKEIVIIILALLVLSSRGKSQTIVNGGFESWPPNCPVNIAPNSWINFSTSIGPDQAGICAGGVLSYQGSSHMNLVWANWGLREGAKQAISGLIVGNTYQISFYAINDSGLYADLGSVFLDFYHNSVVEFSTPELFIGGSWTHFVINFTALATTDTIGFQVVPGIASLDGSVGVDEVSITNVTAIGNLFPVFIVKVNPIPFSDFISFNIEKQNLKRIEVKLKNIVGETVFNLQENNSGNIYTKTIDFSFLSKGIYLLDVIIDEERTVKKIVKE